MGGQYERVYDERAYDERAYDEVAYDGRGNMIEGQYAGRVYDGVTYFRT